MKKFIAITGKIASGKSKAIELLKHRINNHFDLKFIDLDSFCKGVKDASPEIREFFIEHLDNCNPTSESIIEWIIKDPQKKGLYEKYCSLFNQHIKDYLNSLGDGIYIVEASSLFSYPEIHNMIVNVIVISPTDELRKRNLKNRNLSDVSIFDRIFEKGYSENNDDSTEIVKLVSGTLLEMRAKVEYAIIDILYSYDYYQDGYLDSWSEHEETLAYFTDYDKHSINPYHNLNHAISVLTDLVFTGNYNRISGYVALYHDVYYKPMGKLNEQKSAAMVRHFDGCDQVKNDILKTTYKTIDDDIKNFFLSDISHWNRTAEEIIETEKLIFNEYQMVDFGVYRSERLKILNSFKNHILMPQNYINGIELSISWLKSFEPKIGWFCGSFNPFTIGHFDIFKKAEKMFDKVVIIQGVNPNKTNHDNSLKTINELQKYEIYENITDIPKLLETVCYNPILIRGIRNNDDVLDSQNWINCMKEFADVECCLIFGDVKHNHISSSFVRNIASLGYSTKKFVI